jgi:hypothetical protein
VGVTEDRRNQEMATELAAKGGPSASDAVADLLVAKWPTSHISKGCAGDEDEPESGLLLQYPHGAAQHGHLSGTKCSHRPGHDDPCDGSQEMVVILRIALYYLMSQR